MRTYLDFARLSEKNGIHCQGGQHSPAFGQILNSFKHLLSISDRFSCDAIYDSTYRLDNCNDLTRRDHEPRCQDLNDRNFHMLPDQEHRIIVVIASKQRSKTRMRDPIQRSLKSKVWEWLQTSWINAKRAHVDVVYHNTPRGQENFCFLMQAACLFPVRAEDLCLLGGADGKVSVTNVFHKRAGHTSEPDTPSTFDNSN